MRLKKVLAGIMAGTMILGSMNLAFATTSTENMDDLDCSGWWTAHSSGVEIEDGSTVTIDFTSTTYDTAEYNWDTPDYVLYTGDEAVVNGEGYTEYYVGRSDVYGWASSYYGLTENGGLFNISGSTWINDTVTDTYDFTEETGIEFVAFSYPESWETWLASCKEGIDCEIIASLNSGIATIDFTVGEASSTTYIPVEADSPLYLSLTGEMCTLTDISVTVDDGEEDNEDPTADAVALTLNETVTVSTDGKVQYYSFTPSETDFYLFYSSNNSYTTDDEETAYYDPWAELYVLEDGDLSYVTWADDNYGSMNFGLKYKLEAGKTYYYATGYYGVYDVTLTKYDPLEGLDITALTLDVAENVEISDYGTVYYSYTPDETGYYEFYSFNNSYTNSYGDTDHYYPSVELRVIDDEGDLSYVKYNSWANTDGNFSLVYKLEAGTTYYYMVEAENFETAAFDVMLTAVDVDEDHLIYDVTLSLDTTSFDTFGDIVYDGTVTLTYMDGTIYTIALDSVSWFYETDQYGNVITDGGYSWSTIPAVTAAGLEYKVYLSVYASDAVTDYIYGDALVSIAENSVTD